MAPASRAIRATQQTPDPPLLLEFVVKRIGYHVVVGISGEFDFSDEARFNAFWRALTFEPGELLTFDLQELQFADTTACTAMARCATRLRAAGARVEFVSLSEGVIRAFRLAGLLAILDCRL